jgi:hypothetical protein
VLPALGSRRLGMQDGLVLAGVQLTPLPLRLMVVQLRRRPAFRTRPSVASSCAKRTWISPASSRNSTESTCHGPRFRECADRVRDLASSALSPEREGSPAEGVSGGSPPGGLRGRAPSTLPRAQLARGIKNSVSSHYKA